MFISFPYDQCLAPVHSEQAFGIWKFKIMYFLTKYGEAAFYSEKLLLHRDQGKVPGVGYVEVFSWTKSESNVTKASLKLEQPQIPA